jgi:hypothetical protein
VLRLKKEVLGNNGWEIASYRLAIWNPPSVHFHVWLELAQNGTVFKRFRNVRSVPSLLSNKRRHPGFVESSCDGDRGDLLACFHLLHARLRARRAPGIPCSPLFEEGGTFRPKLARIARRDRGFTFQRHCEPTQRVAMTLLFD